jgi:hypothetical protein
LVLGFTWSQGSIYFGHISRPVDTGSKRKEPYGSTQVATISMIISVLDLISAIAIPFLVLAFLSQFGAVDW